QDQAGFEWGVVARMPQGAAMEVPVEPVPLGVGPHRDLFLPFEATIVELEPGWYVVRSEVSIDGAARQEQDGPPFVVPWPRGVMRAGPVAVASRVELPTGSVWIERLELRTDRVEVLWRHERPSAGPDGAAPLGVPAVSVVGGGP